MSQILITGASGTIGRVVTRQLIETGAPVRLARRPAELTASHPHPAGAGSMDGSDSVQQVAFDFADPASWPAAFTGVETMFLLRPPAIADVRRDLIPAVAAAREAGVRHVVFLSLQGAEHNRLVPHAAVEKWLRASDMAWTFIRPSFFCQNLSSTHASDIRDHDVIMVPAGSGATAFVDAEDVGAVAAAALRDPAAHAGRAWTVTGPRALTYEQVAHILTRELDRPIRYTRPHLAAYARHARTALRMSWPMVAVTAAIYTTARLGLAAGLTDDVRAVLGRDPIDFSAFAHRERAAWTRPGT
ncbi:NmrA family NAD(P)-binding protein [Planobispora siamensis]|uniref:NAD(P)-dependent oxidoreductase n=1 Tax=Planobispora siamensis TaxID=936338 RepID=A0A8J3SMG6_9ACTN|nr:NmrA family NAD(P)-binding protein [Planobispora siamensis]GIH95954.1 NAD(P)-dependent oxidoreductase [Planobispora siamensis]